MKVLLISRFSHQERYFRALAAQSEIAMEVLSREDLSRYSADVAGWPWQAESRSLTDTHIDRLTFRRRSPLRVLRPLRRALHALYARRDYSRFLQAFGERQPDAIVVWNGGHWFFQAAIRAAADMGIRVFYCENGLLPNTTTFDPRGVNYRNSVPREAAFYRALPPMPAVASTDLVARAPGRRIRTRPIVLPERYLFVPLQMNRDTQIVFNSPWIRDMYQLLGVLQSVLARIDDRQLAIVVKEHPSCTERYERHHRSLHPRLLFANGNATKELIDAAEGVITVNSTVGLEAMLRERRVIVIGNAFYDIAGLVLGARDEDALVGAINALATWQPDAQLRRQFLGYLSSVYCIPTSWHAPDARHCRRIEERLRNVIEHGLPL